MEYIPPMKRPEVQVKQKDALQEALAERKKVREVIKDREKLDSWRGDASY